MALCWELSGICVFSCIRGTITGHNTPAWPQHSDSVMMFCQAHFSSLMRSVWRAVWPAHGTSHSSQFYITCGLAGCSLLHHLNHKSKCPQYPSVGYTASDWCPSQLCVANHKPFESAIQFSVLLTVYFFSLCLINFFLLGCDGYSVNIFIKSR